MIENVLVPDSITPVVGWRCWTPTPIGLVSAVKPYRWVPRETASAQCLAIDYMGFFSQSSDIPRIHVAPDEKCVCGFYAAKSRWVVRVYPNTIVGRVAMWGKVVEYTHGWRAEHAYPQSFFIPPEKAAELGPFLGQYGVPVLSTEDLPIEADPVCAECLKSITAAEGLRFEDEKVFHPTCLMERTYSGLLVSGSVGVTPPTMSGYALSQLSQLYRSSFFIPGSVLARPNKTGTKKG